MGSRHLRRASQDQQAGAEGRAGDDGGNSDDEEVRPSKPAGFAALLGSGGEEADSDDGGHGAAATSETFRRPSPPPRVPATKEPEPGPEAAPARTGRKKKRNGRRAGGRGDQGGALDQAEVEDVDALVRELDSLVGAAGGASVGDAPLGSGPVREAEIPMRVLAVERRDLSSETEMVRLFGATAIRAVEADEIADRAAAVGDGDPQRPQLPRRVQRNPHLLLRGLGASQHQRGRGRAGAAGRGRAARHLVVMPHDDWPPSQGHGLSMAVEPDGRFRLHRPDAVLRARNDRDLEAAVGTGDPRAVLDLLARQPYHVPTLMCLHSIYLQMNQLQAAAALAERSVHACELAFHPAFANAWLAGAARLRVRAASGGAHGLRGAWPQPDSPGEESHLFLCALWHHAAHLQRKGMHRAALAVTKLVICLDPHGDSTGSLLRVAGRGVRAGEDAFVERLFAEPVFSDTPWYVSAGATARSARVNADTAAVAGTPPPRMEPSYIFSRALSAHRRERRAGGGAGTSAVVGGHGAPRRRAAAPADGPSAGAGGEGKVNGPEASALLADALLWFPTVLRAVLERSSASDPVTRPLIRVWEESLRAARAAGASASAAQRAAPVENAGDDEAAEETAIAASATGRTVAEGALDETLAHLEAAPNETLAHLEALYAEENLDLWRDPGVVSWANATAHDLAARLCKGGPEAAVLRARDDVRAAAFPPGGRDALRGWEFARLSDEALRDAIPEEAAAEVLRPPEPGVVVAADLAEVPLDAMGLARPVEELELVPEELGRVDANRVREALVAANATLDELVAESETAFAALEVMDDTTQATEREQLQWQLKGVSERATQVMLELDALDMTVGAGEEMHPNSGSRGELRQERRRILMALGDVADRAARVREQERRTES